MIAVELNAFPFIERIVKVTWLVTCLQLRIVFHDTSLLHEHMCGNIQETTKQYKESAQL